MAETLQGPSWSSVQGPFNPEVDGRRAVAFLMVFCGTEGA